MKLPKTNSSQCEHLLEIGHVTYMQNCAYPSDVKGVHIFLQVPANFFIVMTTSQRTWAMIRKPVFQCSKIMKCNNEAKALLLCHSPNRYKPTTDK